MDKFLYADGRVITGLRHHWILSSTLRLVEMISIYLWVLQIAADIKPRFSLIYGEKI